MSFVLIYMTSLKDFVIAAIYDFFFPELFSCYLNTI